MNKINKRNKYICECGEEFRLFYNFTSHKLKCIEYKIKQIKRLKNKKKKK